MHCVAGDGLGVLAGAVISSVLSLLGLTEIIVEYVLGFAFGWTIFQSLFMRNPRRLFPGGAGRDVRRELLSINLLMAGMITTVMAQDDIKSASEPPTPSLWFVMSMGPLVGFIVAYPMNWWLVADHLKHGMMTVRPARAAAGGGPDRSARGATRDMPDAQPPMAVGTGYGHG